MQHPGYYRTKPVPVRAFQWDGVIEPDDKSGAWMTRSFDPALPVSNIVIVAGKLQVVTESGTRIAEIGDWIVFWQLTGLLSIVKDEDFDRSFGADERAARVRGWREPPRVKT